MKSVFISIKDYIKNKKNNITNKLLKYALVILAVSNVIGFLKDAFEFGVDSNEYRQERKHTIDVEVVPVITSDLNYQDLIKYNPSDNNDIDMAYDVYLINNNSSDVNISDVRVLVGDTYANIDGMNVENSMTLSTGSKKLTRININLGKIPYEDKVKMFPTSEEKGYWINCVDSYLKKKFISKDDNQSVTTYESDERSVTVYYTLDYDNSSHLDYFYISYPGIKNEKNLIDEISIEEAFVVTKESYGE